MPHESDPDPPPDASLEVWPPEGFSSYYRVTERIAGQAELNYDLVVPGTFAEADNSTTRIGRHGGPTTEDMEFRTELHRRIGAIAVAGGHVEMAMKRLLLVLTGATRAHFSTVDFTWSDLHRRLLNQCDGSDDRRLRLAEVLDWGKENDLKMRRDNTIHADWWEFAGCGARRSRFVRRGNGATILASLSDLDNDALLLYEYAKRLDDLLGNDWMMARLPGPFERRADTTSTEVHPGS